MQNKVLRYFIYILLLQTLVFCEQPRKKPAIKAQAKIAKTDSSGRLSYDLKPSTDLNHKLKAARIEALMQRLYSSHRFNGCVLAGEDGKIIYAKGWGFADLNSKSPLSPHSSFHLASVSKQFTAMAVMMLKEEGKLNYEDDIKKYIPEIPYEGITIRNLLTHTSGIPNILNYIPHYMTFWDSCAIATNSDVAYMLNEHKPRLTFKPGTRFSYNNTGYVLLALIVERVSKTPFDEFLQKRIFFPLRMDDSNICSILKEPDFKERAYGYAVHRSFFSLDEDDIRNGLTGEKGVYSSIIDLYKWDQALYTNLLVKDSTLKEAFSYTTLKNGKKINYGFGWRKSKNEEQVVYHFGHWRGFKTCIIRFTEDHKVIIILNNTGDRRLKYLTKELINILYSEGNKPKL